MAIPKTALFLPSVRALSAADDDCLLECELRLAATRRQVASLKTWIEATDRALLLTSRGGVETRRVL